MATELETLVSESACWSCVSPRKQLEVQTYIIAIASGLDPDPETLSELAKGLDGLSFDRLLAILGYILGQFNLDVSGGAEPSDAQDIIDQGACYRCLSEDAAMALQTYLLSQDPNGPDTDDPSSLLELSECFCGLSTKRLLMIQIYLLATNANLSTDPEDLETGSTEGGFTPVPPHVLQTAVFTSVYVNVEHKYVSGIGPITPAPPCVDRVPVLSNPTYGTNGDGDTNILIDFQVDVPCICDFSGDWVLYGTDNSDGSGGVEVNAIPFSCVASPCTDTFTIPLPIPPYLYIYLTQRCFDLTESAASNVLPMGDPVAAALVSTDWDTRVQANGGSALTGPTIDAATILVQSLMSKQVWDDIGDLNLFAPDSLIASITPIKVTYGVDPWTNANFVDGDLTKYGLKGDGSSKYLDSGVTTNELGHTDMSYFVLSDELDLGASGTDVGSGWTNSAYQLSLQRVGDGSGGPYLLADCPYTSGTGRVKINECVGGGFLLNYRSATTLQEAYFANRWYPFSLVAKNTANVPSLTSDQTFLVFATNNVGPASYSSRRLRAVGFGSAVTQTQASALYDALLTFRNALEDGEETDSENWATRVVRNGGAAPSSANIAACQTFLDALDSAGILSKFMWINVVAPDNLVAAMTPLWRRQGFDPWSNSGIPSGNLTVNGLLGDGAHVVDMRTFAAMPFQTAGPWPGVSAYCYSYGNGGVFGVEIGGPQATLLYQDGTGWIGDIYNATNDRVTWGETHPGFGSVNRTSIISCVGYFANSTHPWASAATNSNVVAGVPNFTNQMVAWGYNNGSGQPSAHRISFLAWHYGLTSTQAQALYNAVVALRTSFGGGLV